MTEPVSRRTALAIGAAGLGGMAVGVLGLRASGLPPFDPSTPPTTVAGDRGAALTEPDVVSSTNGVLDLDLRVAATDVEVGGVTARMLTYNGTVPGPTLHLRPGDRLRVHFTNELDQPTNLHTHGLLVSAEDSGDNPFLSIEPGETFDYVIDLPDDHPEGVFWYHPHRHGLVADQVFAGLYGAIVVDSEEWGESAPRVVVISDTTIEQSRVAKVSGVDRMRGRIGETLLVNGRVSPRLESGVGSVERLLLVNACASRYLDLELGGSPMSLRGFDSGAFEGNREVERLLLVPGSRADVLVTMPEEPVDLMALAYDAGADGMMGSATPADAVVLTLAPTPDAERATTATAPAAASSAAPNDLRGRTLTHARTLTFTMGGMRFLIDGRAFDAARTDQEVALGAVEEWTLSNGTGMDHPFHLHTWPMQIVRVDGELVDDIDVRDVVDVPAGQEVVVRIAFDQLPGRTVYHCHILDHEDQGMMGVVAVR